MTAGELPAGLLLSTWGTGSTEAGGVESIAAHSSLSLQRLAHVLVESESDNATEGVIWKARDLWSAPVERSSH